MCCQNKLIVLVLMILLIIIIPTSSQDCSDKAYIIPTAPLDSAFDSSFSSMRSSNDLRQLIVNPTSENIKKYVLTVAPASGPLFALGILTFCLFWVCIIQICCFQLCKVKACGNEINSSAYVPCCIRILGGLFLIFSILLVLGCIAAIILNNGLITATRKSHCNANNIATQLFEGNVNSSIPWSGVNNFDEYIQDSTLALQNTLSFLQQYFSSANPDFVAITSIASNSLYDNATNYLTNCAKGTQSLTCPFPDNTKCPTTPNPKAVFNQQFCNSSIPSSSYSLINQQIMTNQSKWKTAISNLSNLLPNIVVTPAAVNNLTSQITTLSNDVSKYQNDVETGFTTADKTILGIQIALYILYGLLIVFSIMGIFAFMGAYCMKLFKLRLCIYACWTIFMAFGTTIFILSGILLSFSIFSFDACSAYGYYFSSQANFKELKFSSYSVGTVIQNCFFQNQTTFFSALNATNLSQQMINLNNYFDNAIPNESYSSVVSSIEKQLLDYSNYPENVVFVDQNATNSAWAALNTANIYANFSAPGSGQSCHVAQDKLVFRASNCTPFSTLALPPNPSCLVILNSDTTIYQNRLTAFQTDTTCKTPYANNFDALQAYGNSMITLVNQIYSADSSISTPLLNYEQGYLQYRSTVSNFMQGDQAQLFYAFDVPFTSLNEGASCGFIQTSITGLFTVTCNETFAYLYGFSIINIIIACLLFFLMIFAFYLAPRLAFLQYLDGDYQNIGGLDSERSQNQQKNVQMRNTVDLRQPQEFLTSTDRRNI